MIAVRHLGIFFLISVGLFYPNVSSAISPKRIPSYCLNALKALGSGHFSDFNQLTHAEELENEFKETDRITKDPIDRASNRGPALSQQGFLQLRNLAPKYRTALVLRHMDSFTLDQLHIIDLERWFQNQGQNQKKAVLLQKLIEEQIEKFNEIVTAAQYFDESLEKKYDQDFSFEDPLIYRDPSIESKLNQSLLQGHKLIYNFIQNQIETIVTPQVFINDVIKDFNEIQTSRNQKNIYFQKLTEQTEITNSYLEFLLNYYSTKISPDQFYSIIERYQVRKRQLFSQLFRANQSTPFIIVTRPESWSYYGEILKLARAKGLDPSQIEQIRNLFKIDLKKLSLLAEQYNQYYSNMGVLKSDHLISQNINYAWGRDSDLYATVLNKLALYSKYSK